MHLFLQSRDFFRNKSGTSLEFSDILEKFKCAIENYRRFSFVAYIEYECVIRAVSLLCLQRRYIEMEVYCYFFISQKSLFLYFPVG